MQRQVEHAPTVCGQTSILIDGTEQFEDGEGLVDSAGLGDIEQTKIRRCSGAPGQRLKHDRGKIDLENLSVLMALTARVLHLRPEPKRHPGTESARSTGALVSRRL